MPMPQFADNALEWTFVNPEGETVTFTNLAEYCREHNLNKSAMSRVHKLTLKSYKGWTKSGFVKHTRPVIGARNGRY